MKLNSYVIATQGKLGPGNTHEEMVSWAKLVYYPTKNISEISTMIKEGWAECDKDFCVLWDAQKKHCGITISGKSENK